MSDRKPCEVCGRTAHAGMGWERLAAAMFNGIFAALIFLTRA